VQEYDMSDATERPASDADAWADACAEDLEDEKARRREQYGHPEGSPADELRKLLGAVADKVAGFQGSLPGMAAQSAVQNLVSQARSAVEPVIERNPKVFDHLAAAGGELLAAYRSAVEGHEQSWTRGATAPRDAAGAAGDTPAKSPGEDGAEAPETDPGKGPEARDRKRGDDPGAGSGGSERIDLD
jgi:hypothetical protein